MSTETSQADGPRAKVNKRRKRFPVWRLFFVIVLIVAGFALWKLFLSSANASPKGDRYQAVFLDNGQVFFGKLKNTHGEYLRLENAFYSKAQELPADATAEQKASVNNNVSLIQVGKEVYGPENSLSIRAEQVLFWQNLTKDSKVSKAINSAAN